MRLQTLSYRALFSAGLLLLSSSLAQASPPSREFFQCNEACGNSLRGAARQSWR